LGTPRVVVVGAGVGGLAVAARSALRGCETAVVDLDADIVEAVRRRGGIEVRGIEEGFAPIAQATTVASEAVPDADLVIACVQAPQLASVAEAIDGSLRGGQVVLVKPGCTGGALELRRLAPRGREAGVVFAETDAFAFGCSVPAPGVAKIASVKRSFAVASLPAAAVGRVLERVQAVFPEARAADSVLQTGLSNFNAILHVAPMVANAGRVEAGGPFDFYGDGVTPAIARLMQAHDAERMAVAGAVGVEVASLREWIDATYGVDDEDLHRGIARLSADVYGPVAAPATLEHRFLAEDVECGAVPVEDLGRQLGVDVTATSSCITLASALLGRDLRASGRSAERLGLAGLGADEIRAAVA
jgi:opine dehydrogenase